MYFVYLLKSINFPEQTYVGFTTDIESRLRVHNAGGSPHTAKYKPWILQGYMAFLDKYKALEFEEYLKSHAGKAFANKRLI
jgi:putative endonuclease